MDVWYDEQVARRGSTQYGMPVPTIVHFEQQIDAELLLQADDGATARVEKTDFRGVADGQEESMLAELTSADGNELRKPIVEVDWMSLDQMVCSVNHRCKNVEIKFFKRLKR